MAESKNPQRQKNTFNKLELVLGLLGVSPIPVVGEVCGTIFFYRLLEETPILPSNNKFMNLAMSASITALMRCGMYNSIYKGMFIAQDFNSSSLL